MNKIACPVCFTENFILDLRCSNCGSLIRENIRTINFGEAFTNLIFNPDFEIKRILFSEHKNYSIILLSLLAVKLTIISFFSFSIIDKNLSTSISNLSFYIFLTWIVYIFLLSIFLTFILQLITKHKIKIKNIISVIVYSFIYFSIFGILIFFLELMLFGKYLFSKNPSIFQIDFYKAITVLGIEVILILYSFYLFIKYLVFILQKKFLAIFLTTTFFIFLFIGNEIIKNFIGD